MNCAYPCQEYDEASDHEDFLSRVVHPAEDFFQIKHDGIWCQVIVFPDDKVKVFSKNDIVKDEFQLKQRNLFPRKGQTVLIGEFMYGSQWSQHPDRKDKLIIFDCCMSNGEDVSRHPYSGRYALATSFAAALGPRFEIIKCYSYTHFGPLWIRGEQNPGMWEGFIGRRWHDDYTATLVKVKYAVEDDYVVTGFYEGNNRLKGSLGGVHLAQFDGGKLIPVMDCGGGFSDQLRKEIWDDKQAYMGKVALITGKGRFDSGALRHPAFKLFRDDKLPSKCILKRKSK